MSPSGNDVEFQTEVKDIVNVTWKTTLEALVPNHYEVTSTVR